MARAGARARRRASAESTAERVPGEDDLSADALISKMADFVSVSPDLAEPAATLTPLMSGPLGSDRLLDVLEVVEGQPPSPQFP